MKNVQENAMVKDVRSLIDLVFSDATDDEIIEEVISFLESSDNETGYKVDFIANLLMKADYNYFVDAQNMWDEKQEIK